MSKHTPGPWRAVESGTANLPAYDIEAGKKTGGWRLITYLAASTRTSAEYEEQMRGNARLIAAAPELLEALEAMLRPTYTAEDVSRAVMAVRKAKGEA